jgi:cytochrome oxidase Cu insertion factor (SCO1/SenC/PrrC family)
MSRGVIRIFFATILVLLLLGGTYVALRNGDFYRHVAELQVYGAVPDFAFTERSGKTVQLADLEGELWVVDFIFTRCGSTCPMLSSRMFAIQSALEPDEPVRLVSVSVDPEFDTPEVLIPYAERFKADPERWLFLTGDRSEIYAWIRGGFNLGVEEASGAQRDAGAEEIIHSTRLVVVDREGRIRGYYDAVAPESVDEVVAALRTLIAEPVQQAAGDGSSS